MNLSLLCGTSDPTQLTKWYSTQGEKFEKGWFSRSGMSGKLTTESSKYYARPHTAVARGLDLPTRGLAGRQTAAASNTHCVISVYFPSRWSRASTSICKAETLAFTDCDYC